MKTIKSKGFVIGFLVGGLIGREILLATLDFANVAFGKRRTK